MLYKYYLALLRYLKFDIHIFYNFSKKNTSTGQNIKKKYERSEIKKEFFKYQQK